MSLMGRLLWVTRPIEQSTGLIQRLVKEAACPLSCPLFVIRPDPLALTRLKLQAHHADWLIFVSPSAIDIAWPILATYPPKGRLATVGLSSAQRLSERAGRSVLAPREGSGSEALLAESELKKVVGQRLLVVRGHNGRSLLPDVLAQRGAQVECADIYYRMDLQPDWQRFDMRIPDAIILTSSDMVERLFRSAGPTRSTALQYIPYCVPHPRIAEHLMARGVEHIVTTQADDESLVAGLKKWFYHRP